MAQAKNYSNYVEVVGNVSSEPYVNEKTGIMKFNFATHRKYTKKDGTQEEQTSFLRASLAPKRNAAKQSAVTKGAFLRIKGHLEDNSYRDKDGNYKGGMEIGVDSITVLRKREDGKVENTETGNVEAITDENEAVELENA